jgi:hypothetical protein
LLESEVRAGRKLPAIAADEILTLAGFGQGGDPASRQLGAPPL